MCRNTSPGVAGASWTPCSGSNGCRAGGGGALNNRGRAAAPKPMTQHSPADGSRKPTARTRPGRSAQSARTAPAAAGSSGTTPTRTSAALLSGLSTAWGSGRGAMRLLPAGAVAIILPAGPAGSRRRSGSGAAAPRSPWATHPGVHRLRSLPVAVTVVGGRCTGNALEQSTICCSLIAPSELTAGLSAGGSSSGPMTPPADPHYGGQPWEQQRPGYGQPGQGGQPPGYGQPAGGAPGGYPSGGYPQGGQPPAGPPRYGQQTGYPPPRYGPQGPRQPPGDQKQNYQQGGYHHGHGEQQT